MACPHPGVRRRLLVGGVRSPGESRSGGPFHPGGRGRGEDRTGLRREVARIGVNALIGGSIEIEGVVPGPCSWPGLGLTCVAGVPGGVRSSGKSPRAPVPSGGHRREAERTGEALKPPTDVSLRSAPPMGCCSGVQGLAAAKRQAPAGKPAQPGGAPPSRGTGGTHPARSSCVRNVVTPVGVRAAMSGKPTVRKAHSSAGI